MHSIKKKVLIYGITLNSICLLLIGIFMIFHERFIFIIVLLYIINCMLSAMYKASLSVLLIESTNEDNRKTVYGYNYWFVNLSVALGASIGGMFFSNYSSWLYIISGLMSLFIAIIYNKYLIVPNNDISSVKKSSFSLHDMVLTYKYAISDRNYLLFVLAGMVIFSSEWHLTNFVSVNLSLNNVSNKIAFFNIDSIGTIAFLQVVNTILILTCSMPLSRMLSKHDTKKILLVGMILYGLSYDFMMTTQNFFILIILMISATFGELIFAPTYQVAQIDMMDLSKKGSYSALGSLVVQSSSLLASLILMASQYINQTILAILTAVLTFIAIFTIVTSYSHRKITEAASLK